MSDFLLELSRNPQAKKLVKTLGLPIPMPQTLARAKGPWLERSAKDWNVVYAGDASGPLVATIANTLAETGANPFLLNDDAASVFHEPGEAFGRPAVILPEGVAPDNFRPRALVFNAANLKSPAALRGVYDFFHPFIRTLDKCSRVVVIGRPPEKCKDAGAAATQAALNGFVRSLAKEIGKKGSTANLVYVQKGAADRLAYVLRFLLSRHSAYVTSQPIRVSKEVDLPPVVSTVRPLDGKVALVTGAARGIGAATAKRLAEEGAHVVCLDRPADDGPTSQIARDIGGSVLLVDISDPNAASKIQKYFIDNHGGVDIVVHNAGVTRDKTLARMKPEYWEQAISINLQAIQDITEKLLDEGLSKNGRVVCLSSIAGIAGNMGQTNYAASKAGFIGYVEAMASAFAKKGATINAIAPGFIETRLTAAIPVVIREVARRMASLGQGGLPIDVAEAITFFASPGAAGVNGQVLRVCGGNMVGA